MCQESCPAGAQFPRPLFPASTKVVPDKNLWPPARVEWVPPGGAKGSIRENRNPGVCAHNMCCVNVRYSGGLVVTAVEFHVVEQSCRPRMGTGSVDWVFQWRVLGQPVGGYVLNNVAQYT